MSEFLIIIAIAFGSVAFVFAIAALAMAGLDSRAEQDEARRESAAHTPWGGIIDHGECV